LRSLKVEELRRGGVEDGRAIPSSTSQLLLS
jgi:hypothetical protein